jgi:hypothetical protein
MDSPSCNISPAREVTTGKPSKKTLGYGFIRITETTGSGCTITPLALKAVSSAPSACPTLAVVGGVSSQRLTLLRLKFEALDGIHFHKPLPLVVAANESGGGGGCGA